MAALAAAASSLLATFRPPKDAASNGGCRGCHGVAPSGARWAYMMPQHVGVNAVVYFLGDDADGLTRTCMRGHFYEGCGATFAFTFVANPYRRVLSAAALLWIRGHYEPVGGLPAVSAFAPANVEVGNHAALLEGIARLDTMLLGGSVAGRHTDHVIYLGLHVLILLDLTYVSRFWYVRLVLC